MRVTYTFIYYFSIVMVIMTIFLSLLCIPFVRKLFFKLLRGSNIANNQYFIAARYMVIVVIAVILLDSLYTYFTFKNNLEIQSSDMFADSFQLIKAGQRDDYLILYKKYRELYLAERNFLLTASSLFIYFVYRRFIIAFGKLVDTEKDLEDRKSGDESSQQAKTH